MGSVADVLASCLQEAGLDKVFGLPGGENLEVLDALRRKGFEFFLVHRESSAVFMASATARLTGRPAACLTTLGPGATNAVTGVAHALLDRADGGCDVLRGVRQCCRFLGGAGAP